MITPVPDQPISFESTNLQGCTGLDPEECALVNTDDEVTIQLGYEPCLGEQLLASPNFQDTHDYTFGDGWSVTIGSACYEGPTPSNLVETSFNPTPGNYYIVEILVAPGSASSSSASPEFLLEFGGSLNELIDVPGAGQQAYQFFTQAASTAGITVRPQYATAFGCVLYLRVYDVTPDLTVRLMEDGSPVGDFTFADHPELFTVTGDGVTITFDFSAFEDTPYTNPDPGCYTIRVTDGCDDSVVESQCIHYGDHDCTLLITACNGSAEEVSVSGRYIAKLVRPTYNYSVTEERRSNGYIDRPYADKRRKMELRIDGTGEMAHRFLSSLVLYDHVYIGTAEYVVAAEDYEPAYADVWDSTGGILLSVEPKQELRRKVRCEEDSGGCSPPPNYLVQETGPNELYILQSENGDRILLNQ